MTTPLVEGIITSERPDALLPTMGGQTALNLAVSLADFGALDRLGVRLIGASLRPSAWTRTSASSLSSFHSENERGSRQISGGR
ncbi:hypothetical protein QYE76_024792 [Lolium multiflorum]|uniref:Carbamoyl phosphate synthase preATP-grasp domain-containing protein n=1 Tax=Lolium multiflorum TaxID=4521 RepID=A0AAD8RD30_LOLMU|nr:hypothetical protein QYE76_024792 [Lolium multiflorum]